MRLLTKSNYIKGLECPRYIWMKFAYPKLSRIPSAAEQKKYEEGYKIGELAKKLFPKGLRLPANHQDNLKASKESLKEKMPLFESGFEFNNCYSRADILMPTGAEWDIIEVKSGTRVKDIHIHDVSFQKYVYEGIGLKIRKCFIFHLDENYIRNGDLNINQLFKKEDITDEVESVFSEIESRIEEVWINIASKNQPSPKIFLDNFFKDGEHDCFLERCVEFPDNNVFRLSRGGKKSRQLFEEGIESIVDIPDDFNLTDKQEIQRECEINGQIHVDIKEIKIFLNKLQYPLNYLDFETLNTAVPMFDGLMPYSQVPFQYSLHVVDKEGDEPKHFEFLYSGKGDPREELISSLEKVLGKKGSVVVYYQPFEIKRLEELAKDFPKYKKWTESIIERIIDLIVPFRKFYYYNPVQQGSASIKAVLPAIAKLSYDEMEISDGVTASIKFYNATYTNLDEETKRQIREDLLEYCKLDTLAEAIIVNNLRELVSAH